MGEHDAIEADPAFGTPRHRRTIRSSTCSRPAMRRFISPGTA